MKKVIYGFVFLLIANYSISQNDFRTKTKEDNEKLTAFFEASKLSLTSQQLEEISKINFYINEKISFIEADQKMVKDQKKEVLFNREEDRFNLISKQLTFQQYEKYKELYQKLKDSNFNR